MVRVCMPVQDFVAPLCHAARDVSANRYRRPFIVAGREVAVVLDLINAGPIYDWIRQLPAAAYEAQKRQ